MSQIPGDIASQLQELASRSLRQQVRTNQRFADLLKRISSGEVPMQRVSEELRQFSERETAEYIRTLTTMGISFFSGLLELNQSFNERFFERVGHLRNSHQEAPGESHGKLVLRGSLGEFVRGRFVVENRRSRESDVAMSMSRMVGADGVLFQAPFVIEPANFLLGEGEERSVQVGIRLHPELFHPGQYAGQLTVRGPQDMTLDILIHVEEAAKPEVAATIVTVEETVVAEVAPPGPVVPPRQARPKAAAPQARSPKKKTPARKSKTVKKRGKQAQET